VHKGLSVIENLGVLGVPMPAKMKDFFAQLSENGGVGDADARQIKR